jgi:hypothetical protein
MAITNTPFQVIQGYSPPFTWEEFNKRLESCKEIKDLIFLHLKGFDHCNQLTASLFIEKVKYPLTFYKNRSIKQIEEFTRHFHRLFPRLDSQEEKILSLFLDKLKLYMDLPKETQKIVPSHDLFQSCLNSNKSLSKLWEHIEKLGIDYSLAIIKQILFPDVIDNNTNAFEKRYSETLYFDKQEKLEDSELASRLQLILTFLSMEDRFFNLYLSENELGIESYKIQLKLEEYVNFIFIDKNTSLIYLKTFSEQQNLTDQEWAFVLQYEKETYTQFQQSSAQDQHKFFTQSLYQLNLLQKRNNKEIVKLKKYEILFKYHLLIPHYIKRRQEIENFKSISSNSHIQQFKGVKIDAISNWITPLAKVVELLDNSCAKSLELAREEGNRDKALKLWKEYYEKKKTIVDFWLKVRDQQNQLFIFTYNKLNELIKRKPFNQSSNWYCYKKNLALTPIDDIPHIALEAQLSNTPIPSIENELAHIFNAHLEEIKTVPLKSENKIKKSKKKEAIKRKSKPNRPHNKVKKDKKVEDKKILEPEPILGSSDQKQKLLGENFPFTFHGRIKRWLNHPFGHKLPESQFPDYQSSSFENQKLKHAFHAFNSLVDRFYDIGIQDAWHNPHNSKQEARFIIPADLSIQQKTYRGLIVYCIDEGMCYHRYFHEKESSDIQNKIRYNTFTPSDFPELTEEASLLQGISSQSEKNILEAFGERDFPKLGIANQALKEKTLPSLYSHKETIQIDPLLGTVTIEDKDKQMIIKLFRIKPYFEGLN